MRKISKYLFLLLAVVSFSACEDYLDVKPKDRIIPTTGDDFRDLLSSAYNAIPADKAKLAFRTDEVKLNESRWDLSNVKDIYMWNDANPADNTITYTYDIFYKVIMYANHVIAEGGDATEATQEEVDQIVGEAYLLRAYIHFYLTNMFGKPYQKESTATDQGIPLSLKIDSEAEYIPNTVAEVYEQIQSDIAQGLSKLTVDTYATGLNYRFSKVAALAFQSRVYLYMAEYAKAQESALEALKLKSDLQDLVADNSKAPHMYDAVESILAMDDNVDKNLRDEAYISEEMKAAFDQTNDLRFALYFEADGEEFAINKGLELASKCTFRTAELYLIVAECKARLDELEDSKDYLNQLKAKRLTADFYATEETRINALNKADLIAEIAAERFRELAFEGHRWFDLRRTTQQSLTHKFKDETAVLVEGDPRYTLRFPQEAIDNNPNLRD
ncbi:RagB/SusD family nutrient uptake outer membrane protein [Marinifilum fragile]|uniref:RagB/SusD family nutrient uptake outer membrane protein n=1 Tax=Marinifilum fragile TaxID=570161 RepID=UPI000A47C155|nr:RagB/SusD family nutrient uptake outer membrane protein [Marinifilum fragile]